MVTKTQIDFEKLKENSAELSIRSEALIAAAMLTSHRKTYSVMRNVQVGFWPDFAEPLNPTIVSTNSYSMLVIHGCVKGTMGEEESFLIGRSWIKQYVRRQGQEIKIFCRDGMAFTDKWYGIQEPIIDDDKKFPDWRKILRDYQGCDDGTTHVDLELLMLGLKALDRIHGGTRKYDDRPSFETRQAEILFSVQDKPIIIKSHASGLHKGFWAELYIMPINPQN